MALVTIRDNPDENGRKPITRYTTNPARVEADRGKAGMVEVPDEQLNKPSLDSHQKARPWLNQDGNIEWDIEERPIDDPAQLAKRISQIEDRLAALESS